MTNVEKVEKIEEVLKEIAILDNKNVDEAVKMFSDQLDEMYVELKMILNSFKELKGSDNNEKI